MDKIINTLLPALYYAQLPTIVLGVLLVISLYLFFATTDKEKREKRLKLVIIGTIAFRALYVLLLSAAQYYVWSHEKFTQLLLPPTQPFSYFFFYIWGRFLLNFVIILGLSFAWYAILKSLERYRSSLFEAGEMKLGFLCAFLVGWPEVVIFIPLFFITVVIVSLVRRVFFKKQFTTIGIPLAIAAVVTFVCAFKVIEWLHLGALNI